MAQIAAFFQAQTIEKTPPAAAALYASTAKEVRTFGSMRWRERLYTHALTTDVNFLDLPLPCTIQQEHVAVLAKFSGGERDGEVLVSVKASSPALAADLVADAQALLCTL